MKIIYKVLLIGSVVVLFAIGISLYATRDRITYYGPGENGFIVETSVGQTFSIRLNSSVPLPLMPCWLDIPKEIQLVGDKHIMGLRERLKYESAGDGKDIYTFRALKEGTFRITRGECLGSSPEGGWDDEMKEMDSTATDVYTVIVTR